MNKDELNKKIGDSVRKIREKKGLTQAALAEETGKIKQTIQKLESGKFNPSAFFLSEIAKGLEVDLKELFDF